MMRVRRWQTRPELVNEQAASAQYSNPTANTVAGKSIQQPVQQANTVGSNSLYNKLVNKLSQAKNAMQQDLNPIHNDMRYHGNR